MPNASHRQRGFQVMVDTVNEQPKECGTERAALAQPHGWRAVLLLL